VSAFSAEWLRLREPADHRARDAGLMSDVARLFEHKPTVRIVDLGAGLGSNLRALAPSILSDQQWRLLDHDAALLAATRHELCTWGDGVERGGGIALQRDGRSITARTEALDLFRQAERIFEDAPDLVTAAALFDLVSPQWIETLAELVVRYRVPFYAALTYDGRDEGDPSHPLDGQMLKALHVHQLRDKGFGPAAGPHAIRFLEEAFAARGYRVSVAPSPWTLDDADSPMLTLLGEGVARAVAETGLVLAEDIVEWRRFHMPDGRWRGVKWTVGHADLFAVPPTGR
jgi:hypothetical protein